MYLVQAMSLFSLMTVSRLGLIVNDIVLLQIQSIQALFSQDSEGIALQFREWIVGNGAMVQWLKPLFAMLASHIRAPGFWSNLVSEPATS